MGLLKTIDKIIRPEMYSSPPAIHPVSFSKKGIPIYYRDGCIFKNEEDVFSEMKKDKSTLNK